MRKAKGRKLTRGMDKASITRSRVLFVDAFFACNMNRCEAARQALGATGAAAYTEGRRMMHDPIVQRMLDERFQKLRPFQLRADEVLRKLAAAIDFNPKELYDENNRLRPMADISDEAAQCIDGVDVERRTERRTERGAGRGEGATEVETTRVRHVKRTTVLDMAMRACGLYAKDNAQRLDPDEAARAVRERLGQIDQLTAPAKAARHLGDVEKLQQANKQRKEKESAE